jgi:hypothetical protein
MPMNGPNELGLHYTRLDMLTWDKHSSLVVIFISKKENKVLGIRLRKSEEVSYFSVFSIKRTSKTALLWIIVRHII